MFQPQPTPYSSFAAYGISAGLPHYAYQPDQIPSSSAAAGTGLNSGGGGWLGLEGAATTGGATASAPSEPSLPIYTPPTFNPGAGPGAFPPFNNSNNPTPPLQGNVKMESNMTDDLAAQEAAARDYQPEPQGPLVGTKTPSHVITQEYSKADTVYVEKTIALPQSYSHYRPIRGDGNCGWRAIAYSYFETLIRTGDQSLVDVEHQRLTQTPIVGHDEFVYEDMREETGKLMKDISAAMGNQQTAMSILLQKFNDPDTAEPILYYIRLLASSWLKSDPEASKYLDFIPDGLGMPGYCQEYLELPGREIEHLGIVILVNVLLRPVGFILEIAYLDRSPGPTVNKYVFPEGAGDEEPSNLGPVIYLLFRPDHYDILYRDPPTAPITVQVNRASFPHSHDITSNTPSLSSFAGVDLVPLALLPGFSGMAPGLSTLAVPSPSSLDSYASSPQQSWITDAQYSAGATPTMPEHHGLQPTSMIQPPAPTGTPPLRFSEYCHPSLVENDIWREQTFTTNTFKNSHFNVAHYNNPNFQPEEYRPDGDEAPEPRACGRKRSNA